MEIYKKNNLFGLKNDEGDIVLPPKFYKDFVEEIKNLPLQELIKIKLVDIQFDLRPDGMYAFGCPYRGIGLKNYNGEVVVENKYIYIYHFQSNELARVRIRDKFGLVNKQNEVIVECNYEDIYNFRYGLAIVKLNNKYGVINEEGEVVAECKYGWIYDFQPNRLARAKLNGKWGFINEKGEWLEDENV